MHNITRRAALAGIAAIPAAIGAGGVMGSEPDPVLPPIEKDRREAVAGELIIGPDGTLWRVEREA